MGGFRTLVPLRRNRLHWFAGRTHEILDEIGQPATWAMTPHEHGETIAELLALRSRIDAHLFAVVADADRADVAASGGATSTAAWVRAGTGVTGAEATRLVRQARAVESHPSTHTALAQGVIHTEQATVIVAAVDALPPEVADHAPHAETHLLAAAEQHDARTLRGLGRHLLEVIAPDAADALIARHLEHEETQARTTCFLKTWSDGHGSTYGRFKIPDLTGTILTTALEAYANPNRPDPIPRQGAATPQIYGQALCELLEHLPADRLPQTGGINATVIVTMTLDTLLGGLHAANLLGTDTQLSPGQARRLAAAAGIIPAVLNSQSQLLDLGRRRTYTQPQRIAMALRQGGLCNIKGCERPATWCDANHRHLWSQGGRTTIDPANSSAPATTPWSTKATTTQDAHKPTGPAQSTADHYARKILSIDLPLASSSTNLSR